MSLQLKNIMEELVIKRFDEMCDDLKCCKCEKCRLDIISYTLNCLPPKYIVSSQGELFAKLNFLDKQFDANIITTLTQAAQIIGTNPRHQ